MEIKGGTFWDAIFIVQDLTILLLGDEMISSIAICCSFSSADTKCSILCFDVEILHSNINYSNAFCVKFATRVLRSENSFREIDGRSWDSERDQTEWILLYVRPPCGVGVGLYLEAIGS
jgi:hypothetical protein